MRTFGAALLMVSVSAFAGLPSIDPHIAFVTTGGFWESGRDRGQFRVVVTNQGWEHVSSKVELQWLLEDVAARDLRLHKSVEVKELGGGLMSVGQPTFTPEGTVVLHASLKTGESTVFSLTPLQPGMYRIAGQ